MDEAASERRAQWLRGILEVTVLALLDDRESYGYELAQALELSGIGPIKGGTLYPVLLRLQRADLIAAAWREGDGGPARKYYRLTDAGRRELRETTAAWRDFTARVDGLLKEGGAG